ncbi:MAG: CsgG/HfaB family protein [Succinivibrio sp.]
MNKSLFSKGKMLPVLVTCALALSGCAIESHHTVQTESAQQSVIYRSTSAEKILVSIGLFANHSDFQNGIFANGTDKLGSQAQTILTTYLQQAGCFMVLDRSNMNALKAESTISNKSQKLKGARYVITGDIVEYGRKTVGDRQLFGILGKGKSQVAYSKVNINIVDVETSAVVYSAEGAGEFSLSSRDVLGFGSTAGYDATLNGKVLSLSIRDAVNKLTAGIDNGMWTPEK